MSYRRLDAVRTWLFNTLLRRDCSVLVCLGYWCDLHKCRGEPRVWFCTAFSPDLPRDLLKLEQFKVFVWCGNSHCIRKYLPVSFPQYATFNNVTPYFYGYIYVCFLLNSTTFLVGTSRQISSRFRNLCYNFYNSSTMPSTHFTHGKVSCSTATWHLTAFSMDVTGHNSELLYGYCTKSIFE